MDSQIDLQQPVLDGGIRSINFFNGRLLSARDLTLEQSAYREADRRLGKAMGDGVAYGLEVSQATKSNKQSPAVSVEAGLAVNRRGQMLMLEAPADVALVRTVTALASSKVFAECEPLQTGAYVSGAGVYLLTIAPAQTTEGRAITNGMNPATATCNSDTIVNAVQFRLIQLDPPITNAELQDKDHLRNLIAYKCFGVAETAAFFADPFGPEVKQWGLLDTLRPNQLTDCEVPLAVLYWTNDGLNFIDMWSVRRELVEHCFWNPLTGTAYSNRWPRVFSGRRLSESHAAFLQFEDQIDDIRKEPNLVSISATQRFAFLPPAGIIPVTGAGSARGFDTLTFFGSLASRDIASIDADLVTSLLNEALYHEPIDLSKADRIQLYSIWENGKALERGEANQRALVFASHTLAYRGVARFGSAKWSLSRFAQSVI